MLITEKMERVSIFLPREDETLLWERLGRFGRMQPGVASQVPKLSKYLSFIDLSAIESTLRETASFLGVDLAGPVSSDISPLDPEALQKKLDELSEEMAQKREQQRSLREEERSLHREIDHVRLQRSHVEMLGPLKVDIGSLQELKRFCVMTGTLPLVNLDSLERSLKRIPHALIPYGKDRHRLQLFVVCLPEQLPEFTKILEAALFRQIEIPKGLHGAPQDALREISRREDELSKKLRAVEERAEKLESWRKKRRAELSDFLVINAATIAACKHAGQTEKVSIAIGWVPKREIETLERIVSEHATWVLEAKDLPYTSSRDDLGLLIPGKLRNPPFFRAFESLVRVYGTPIYGGFDPTIIFTGLFVIMFGMMFGDVGHGGILLLSGLLLRLWPRLRSGFRNTGTILIGVGTASMVFGALYGSVFGYENILPAIWFRPMDDINRLLLYAIILGAGVIVVGILVNIAVKLVQHRYLDLSYERFGLLGLWFYLGAIGMVMMLMKGGSMNILVVFVMMFLPLLLMPIVKMITRRWRKGDEEEEESGFTGLIVAGVDLFEGLLVYLSNSISFVRVAAFALNHVALSLAIFQLGRMLESMVGGGGILYIITVAGGNLLILVLEGGIVGIQTLRLEFYEFFSKFFDEEGTAFVPFAYRLESNRR